jgi:hypothetical protein
MACEVRKGEGGLEEVTFLYRLTPGACPKSYGVNVAQLAGYFQATMLISQHIFYTEFKCSFHSIHNHAHVIFTLDAQEYLLQCFRGLTRSQMTLRPITGSDTV